MTNDSTSRTAAGYFQQINSRLTRLERRLPMSSTATAVVPGTIVPFAGSAAPTGWLLCDGAVVSRALYAALFSAIGTTFGAGDGSTTFGLPDLRGRVGVGVDTGQTEFDTLGETGGAKTTDLDAAGAYARIVHSVGSSRIYTKRRLGIDSWTTETSFTTSNQSAGTAETGATEVAGTIPNLPPYQVVNYIISTGNVSGVGGGTGVVAAGAGIDVTGDGTTGAPYTISIDPVYPDVDPFQPGSNGFTYGTGWSSYGSSNWSGLWIARRGGMVSINGAAAKSSWSTGDAMLNIPAGFRPNRQVQGVNCQCVGASSTAAPTTLNAGAGGTTATSIMIVYPVGA